MLQNDTDIFIFNYLPTPAKGMHLADTNENVRETFTERLLN